MTKRPNTHPEKSVARHILPGQYLVFSVGGVAVASLGLLFMISLWPALAVISLALIGLTIQDLKRLRAHCGFVSVTLHTPPSCQRGETIAASLQVSNPGRVDFRVRLRPILPSEGRPDYWESTQLIPSGSTVTVPCPIKTDVRGRYHFGDILVRLTTSWRLIEIERVIAHRATVRVLPDIAGVKDYLNAHRADPFAAPHLRTARIRGIGCEFESLREFEPGDDIRRIDWRATARHRRLISRNYEIEPFRDVLVVLDNGRLMGASTARGTKLDWAIDAALVIAGVVLQSGDRCGLLVFGNEITSYLKPRPSLTQLNAFVEALFDKQPTLEESHFRLAFTHLQSHLTKRCLVIILSTLTDVDPSGSMLAGLLSLSKRHLVILTSLRTPELDEVIQGPTRKEIDPFRKAVVYRLFEAENNMLAKLRRGGVHTLDVTPEQLTVPVINKYIELRERNLL